MRQRTRKRAHLIGLILACVLLLTLVVALMFPLIKWLSQPDTQSKMQEWVASLGWIGILVTLLLQMVQVIIAVIPGEPFELLAGVLYGGLGGMIICIVGCYLATLIVYHLSRRLGKPVVRKLLGEKSFEEFSFMQDRRRQETTVFILFLIPGIPKDILTYFSGFGVMSPLAFATVATLARIPAIAASTFIGGDIMEGNWVAVVVLFAIVTVLGLLGIHYKDRVVAYLRRRKA